MDLYDQSSRPAVVGARRPLPRPLQPRDIAEPDKTARGPLLAQSGHLPIVATQRDAAKLKPNWLSSRVKSDSCPPVRPEPRQRARRSGGHRVGPEWIMPLPPVVYLESDIMNLPFNTVQRPSSGRAVAE